MSQQLEPLDGGVCATPGIRAAGLAAGLKPSGRLDVALVAAETAVSAAGVQTTNQVRAAPVKVTGEHLQGGLARAILLNAGNANACTGPDGEQLARDSAAAVAAQLGCPIQQVLVASTGVIGVPLPADRLLPAIPGLIGELSAAGHAGAAQAILTTDTVAKEAAVRVTAGDTGCVVGGMAKGSGMIAPELATMLCVLTTDAPLEGPAMRALLKAVTDRSFGRISVDECRSTNDAVLLLATGTAAHPPPLAAVTAGLQAVCDRLAEAMVRDGEGASRLVRVCVRGALTEDDALGVARSIGSSLLVKTALAGGDPNWGRVLAAMGAGPVRFDPERVRVSFGRVEVCRFGMATAFDRGLAAAALRGPEVELTVDLDSGGGAQASLLTCDLTHDYITINAEYTT